MDLGWTDGADQGNGAERKKERIDRSCEALLIRRPHDMPRSERDTSANAAVGFVDIRTSEDQR